MPNPTDGDKTIEEIEKMVEEDVGEKMEQLIQDFNSEAKGISDMFNDMSKEEAFKAIANYLNISGSKEEILRMIAEQYELEDVELDDVFTALDINIQEFKEEIIQKTISNFFESIDVNQLKEDAYSTLSQKLKEQFGAGVPLADILETVGLNFENLIDALKKTFYNELEEKLDFGEIKKELVFYLATKHELNIDFKDVSDKLAETIKEEINLKEVRLKASKLVSLQIAKSDVFKEVYLSVMGQFVNYFKELEEYNQLPFLKRIFTKKPEFRLENLLIGRIEPTDTNEVDWAFYDKISGSIVDKLEEGEIYEFALFLSGKNYDIFKKAKPSIAYIPVIDSSGKKIQHFKAKVEFEDDSVKIIADVYLKKGEKLNLERIMYGYEI